MSKLFHAFIFNKVNYGLLTGLPKKKTRKLLLIQNAAARVLAGTKRSDITTILNLVHWHPVSHRIEYKAEHGEGPNTCIHATLIP